MLNAVGLTPSDSSTVHIYTQTIHKTTQLIWKECGLCPVFASYTLAFALQLRKKHGKTSVMLRDTIKKILPVVLTQACTVKAATIHHQNTLNTVQVTLVYVFFI